MKRNKVIFCDVDGTILFHENHNLNLKDRNIIDVSTSLYKDYIDQKTIELFHKLSKDYLIVFVTGARFSTLQSRVDILNFFDYAIIESGGIILDKNLNKDKDWEEYLSNQINELKNIQSQLEEDNWNLDIKGRTCAIRVRKQDNSKKSEKEFNQLYTNFKLPKELKITKNLGSIDIILERAGKANSVQYLLKKLNLDQEDTIGIGDDINDIEMLELTNQSYVLGSCYKEILDVAKQKKWYISKGKYFNGINEILKNIMRED